MNTSKKLQIEDRHDWERSYGDFSQIYPNARNFFKLSNHYVDLKKDGLYALEYGCALGYYLKVLMHDNLKAGLYGIDIANKAIESSIYNTGLPRKHFFWQACGTKVPLDSDSLDFIYGLDIIEHIAHDEEIDNWFTEVKRLLKEKGVFIIVTPNSNWLMRRIYNLTGQTWIYKGKAHRRYFTRRSLCKWTKKYFHVLHCGLYNHRPSPFKKFLRYFGVSKHIIVVLQKNEN